MQLRESLDHFQYMLLRLNSNDQVMSSQINVQHLVQLSLRMKGAPLERSSR